MLLTLVEVILWTSLSVCSPVTEGLSNFVMLISFLPKSKLAELKGNRRNSIMTSCYRSAYFRNSDMKGRRCHRKCSDLNTTLVRGPVPSSLGVAGGLGDCIPFLIMIIMVGIKLVGFFDSRVDSFLVRRPGDQKQMSFNNFIFWCA